MYDVVIAGAGPVGLFLASELALADCSVVVLERDADPRPPLKELPLGLRGLNAASAETFSRRGLLQPLLRASGIDAASVGADPAADRAPAPRSLGHFAGIMLDAAAIDPDALAYRLPGPAMDGFMTSLAAVGDVLAERATALGVTLVRGAPVTALAQDEQTVTVTAGGRDYTARWVVGCDGGRSTVRTLAGFSFVGTEPLFTGYVAKVTFDDPRQLPLGFQLTETGMYLRTPLEGHLGMMDFDGGTFDRSRPLTREHLQEVLRRVSGTEVTLKEVHLASSFTDRAMQATAYRHGRILLAGDAAHIHSPLGGQGLNLGIGDAMNLGWKLAATVRGNAPEDLLDTYTAERHPVGAAVLDWSRAQVATMHPGPNAPALQHLIRDLMATSDGTTHVYRRSSGLFHRYDLGSDQPLIGRTAPDFRLNDTTSLSDLLQDGRGVLLDFSPHQSLSEQAAPWKEHIAYVPGRPHNDLGFEALLIRPDGIVAWADVPGTRAGAGLQGCLARWFTRS
ncbi:2-polyprenyl-6-methoxyphenol hydroxylase [Streptomyces sp. TverLS-915]|uniref:FAD-dependent oxidoreductase n=1 Tax=unclassified Streptomyces TaxID=2593676 RepID=UPI00081D7745|nr:FAD-dependent oxidoreductase [Streptomyces sp. TverLS-915]SCD82213.1 2-polyprenyl-6-methoxyphenol hydroxylase [Streptomyces sp. TverLS-915]